MTKKELINVVQEKVTVEGAKAPSKVLVGTYVDAVIDAIQETVASGEEVRLPGFGTFSVTERGEREATNPRTGEKMMVGPTKTPKFKAGTTFKNMLKGE